MMKIIEQDFKELEEYLQYLFFRYQDESEYEEKSEYVEAIKKSISENEITGIYKKLSLTRKSLKLNLQYNNDLIIQFYVTNSRIGFKDI